MARLEGLPLRPSTARAWIDPDANDDGNLNGREREPGPAAETVGLLDPGWLIGRARGIAPLDLVAASSWWMPNDPATDAALDRLWKHGVATAVAARKLAEEAGDPTPDRLFRIGLVHALGYWAAAVVDRPALAEILAEPNPTHRRYQERTRFGGDMGLIGKELADRWDVDPLLAEAAWLLSMPEGEVDSCSSDPRRLRILRRARDWADRTPWGLGGSGATVGHDPPRQWVMVEVQGRCRQPFLDVKATEPEAALVRRCARLQTENLALRDERDGLRSLAEEIEAVEGDGDPAEFSGPTPESLLQRARRRWDRWKADRIRRAGELEALVAAVHEGAERQVVESRRARREGLAEFAAGAGHELNNPLAVIVGRAQLLLARQPDPDTVQSLKIVIAQARRAHRILRDLIYVARPPELRPKPCEPEAILRHSVNDLQGEAEARGIAMSCRTAETGSLIRADAEGLRHLADVLVRNALEATPNGGEVRVTGDARDGRLEWSVADTGRGIADPEADRLFDPFYCGRQAGRGLGLGLPRAARFIDQCGGTLRWRSHPGQGTTFHVSLPAERVQPPDAPTTDLPITPGRVGAGSDKASRPDPTATVTSSRNHLP